MPRLAPVITAVSARMTVIEACEASGFDSASKCSSTVSPHPIRRSAVRPHLNGDIPKEIAADRGERLG
jgi:hypothetical protein